MMQDCGLKIRIKEEDGHQTLDTEVDIVGGLLLDETDKSRKTRSTWK